MSKRDELIVIATKLFSERGYENTPVSVICAKANVSKGLISHHFKSKDGLLREIFIKGSKIIEEFNDVDTENLTSREQVIELINSFFDGLKREKLLFQFNLNVILQPKTREVLKDLIDERRQFIHKSMWRIFKELYPENYLIESTMFIAKFDGIAYDYLEADEDFPLDQIREYLIEEYSDKGKI